MNNTIKNAIIALVMVAVALISIMMFIKPNLDERSSLESDISQLQTQLADLQSKEADRPVYEAGIVQNQQKFKETLDKFPEGIDQANYIHFLGELEDNKDLDDFTMSDETFTEVENFYTLSKNGSGPVATDPNAAGGTATASSNATASGNASSAVSSDAEYGDAAISQLMNEDMTGLKETMTINYTGNYKGIKNLIAYVESNDKRMTIDSISLAYDEENQALSGSFSFNLYAITSSSRQLTDPDLKDIDIGTKNIFDSKDSGDSAVNKAFSANLEAEKKKIQSDYDYSITLNPATSNAAAIQIASKADASTALKNNENSVQNATIKFFMIGDKYYVSYNIGDTSYPENFDQGVEFDPGTDLNLLIQSSKRKNDKDASGVKLVIDNETSMPLNVAVDGDDPENPRLNIVSRIGKVNLYQ